MKIEVNALGLVCPEPIMLLHKAIRDSDSGDLIELVASDKSTERDVEKFCEFLGHQLVAVSYTHLTLPTILLV